jgi:hypothetical protein
MSDTEIRDDAFWSQAILAAGEADLEALLAERQGLSR